MQIVTLILCRGNVYVLGEAYAFGVTWSFVFKALAVLVLRYRDKRSREWKVPFNLKLGGVEFPFGLAGIFAVLFLTASVNLLTKRVATISGALFTMVFFIVFEVSEKINARKHAAQKALHDGHGHIDKVNMGRMDVLTHQDCGLEKPNRVLVAVRDPKNLSHLKTYSSGN